MNESPMEHDHETSMDLFSKISQFHINITIIFKSFERPIKKAILQICAELNERHALIEKLSDVSEVDSLHKSFGDPKEFVFNQHPHVILLPKDLENTCEQLQNLKNE